MLVRKNLSIFIHPGQSCTVDDILRTYIYTINNENKIIKTLLRSAYNKKYSRRRYAWRTLKACHILIISHCYAFRRGNIHPVNIGLKCATQRCDAAPRHDKRGICRGQHEGSGEERPVATRWRVHKHSLHVHACQVAYE